MRRKVGQPLDMLADGTPSVVQKGVSLHEATAPNWVPPAVRAIAAVFPIGPNIAKRLLTDERMRGVWKYLRRADIEVGDNALAHLPPSLRLETYDIPIQRLSNRDRACAAVFGFAVAEFSSKRNVWTRARLRKFAARWNDATELCRWVSAEPMFDPEFRKAASEVVQGFEKHARILEDHGRLVEIGPDARAYYMGRSQGTRNDERRDEVRGKTRKLALMMGRFYGDRMYGVTATISAVAAQTKVTKRDVRNWCRDLGGDPAT